ncbi:hypothetical protein D3C85_223660 [compost metagenome]
MSAYLSQQDKVKVNILEGYAPRKLTNVEVIINEIRLFDWTYPDSDCPKAYRAGAERKEVLRSAISYTLGDNPTLATLARAALEGQQARNDLFDKYPYVKHFDLMNAKYHKGLLGCHLAGIEEHRVRGAISFLKDLYDVVVALPANKSNVFISTNRTPMYRELRAIATNSKVPALFGMAIPAPLQKQVYELLRINTYTLDTIQTFNLHCVDEMMDYYKNHPSSKEAFRVFNMFEVVNCPYVQDAKYLQVIMNDRYYSFYVKRNQFV